MPLDAEPLQDPDVYLNAVPLPLLRELREREPFHCICPVSPAHRPPPARSPKPRSERFKGFPLQRDGDAIDDIGATIAFLLSDASQYLTGQTLMLDGGSYLRP